MSLKYIYLFIYLFIWLHQVLVVAGTQDLQFLLRNAVFGCAKGTLCCDLWDLAPWPGIEPGSAVLAVQSLKPLAHQGSPSTLLERGLSCGLYSCHQPSAPAGHFARAYIHTWRREVACCGAPQNCLSFLPASLGWTIRKSSSTLDFSLKDLLCLECSASLTLMTSSGISFMSLCPRTGEVFSNHLIEYQPLSQSLFPFLALFFFQSTYHALPKNLFVYLSSVFFDWK